MLILGIESSCDDTSASVIKAHDDPSKRILSNIVHSQMDHIIHGGVVPEIAARAHIEKIQPVIDQAIKEANINYSDLDAIAATCGPGLIGGVMIGMVAGKALAYSLNKPFLAINHLEGHALTPRLSHDVAFPYLLLLVSGGHTQLVLAKAVGDYECLGTTLDDAAGECFDKSAKMMGLPFPGGPNLEKLAEECDQPQEATERFPLPSPMKGREGCDFSFSGLKTAIRNHVQALQNNNILPRQEMIMLAYALQYQMADILKDRTANALQMIKDKNIKASALVVSGGVAANKAIRKGLENLAQSEQLPFIAPPMALCTDNGAMIAWAGCERFRLGDQSPLSTAARPRWPLAELNSSDHSSPLERTQITR